MTKVRLAAAGWETFTGSFGFQAEFKDGVSVNPLTPRQIARIGSTTKIVDAETGEQLGPAAAAAKANQRFSVEPIVFTTQAEAEVKEEANRETLVAEEKARKALEAEALAEAKAKAEAEIDDIVIYSRVELEAIGANDGIVGLREIGKPLDINARSISEIIDKILAAQAKVAG